MNHKGKIKSYTRISGSKLCPPQTFSPFNASFFSIVVVVFVSLQTCLYDRMPTKSPQGGHGTKYAFTQVAGGLREEARRGPP